MAELASKFNVGRVIQYYSDQWGCRIQDAGYVVWGRAFKGCKSF